jgi:hypothetical protein
VTTTAAPLSAPHVVGARLGLLRRTTPMLLRSTSVAIVLLTLLTGLVAALAVSERQSATFSAWQSSEPLLVRAQDIDTSLSDADTTAAASFLQGRTESAGLASRYQADVARASSDLAVAAQEAGSDPALAASLQTISTELPVYAGIVQEANFNERQAFYPLAAAYLSEANNLMRTTLLPAAAQVYGTEQSRLQGDQNQAVSPWLAVLAVVALLALLAALFSAQRSLSGRFNRTWNLALVGATVIVLALGIWGIVALAVQGGNVTSAMADGSHPVSTFTQARILALRARADDELTLLTRDADPTFQQDYGRTASALQSLLASGSSSASFDTAERQELANAKAAFASYQKLHTQIRQADTSAEPAGAVALAKGSGSQQLPAVSSDLDAALSGGIGVSQGTFVDATSGAGADLDGLVWGIALGSVLVAVLVLVGFQPRIEEYR